MSVDALLEHPLFLPPGSVRAIIAISLIGGTIYAYLTNPGDVPEGLIAMSSAVGAFYFGAKSKVM